MRTNVVLLFTFSKGDTNEACVVCFQDTNDSTNKYQSQVCLFPTVLNYMGAILYVVIYI